MMRWLVNGSVKSKGLIVALGIGVLILGAVQLRSMPRDLLPEFSPATVQVQTEALGLSAEEVEQLITVPLEQDLLNGVACLDVIRSESVPGMSKVELIFEPGTEPGRARQVVQERLTQAAALPNVSRPPQMLQPLSSTSRLVMVGLLLAGRSLTIVGVLARWTIRPRLMASPASPTWRCGGSGSSSSRSRWTRRARRAGRHARRGHPDRGQRAVGVAADVPGGVDPGGRWLLRHAQPAPRRRAQQPIRRRRTWPG